MPILDDRVAHYLWDLRPERGTVMREMEQLAEQERIPIVHWETGRFLATLVRALAPERVLEIGTAIGYSTLHMAEVLDSGRIFTIERDAERIEQARGFLDLARVADRVEVIEGDALEEIGRLDGPWDLIFVDAAKTEYPQYVELTEPKAAERAVLVIDNMLMFGEVALPKEVDTFWDDEKLDTARSLSAELLHSERWLGSVLPIGDGVGFAVKR
jgi:predicted O-methyltransferase YrrM